MITKRHEKSRSRGARAPIGVFDSGVGGLSILTHLRAKLPGERFVFLADQSYVPYGAKSEKQLKRRATKVVRFLLAHRVKLVVVACNTATCYAVDHLRTTFPIPFIGTVPAIRPACAASRTHSVAVLSTPATAQSAALKKLIREHGNGCIVTRIGCIGLEEAVEEGSLRSAQTRALLNKYVSRAVRAGADRIVLGCTHYPFLRTAIRTLTTIPCTDSGTAIARHTHSLLSTSSLLRAGASGSAEYWTTGGPERFDRVASELLRVPVHSRKATL